MLSLVLCCQVLCAQQTYVPTAEITVAAASDLAPLESALTNEFKRITGARARFTFAASGILARQISAGAPFDVYLSANATYVRELQKGGSVESDSVRVYAIGRLGVWSARGLGWQDLGGDSVKHIAMANPAHAPYGNAAREALMRAGLWERLQPRLVFGENVRQALQFAETGNADVVITAWSLIKDRRGSLVDPRLYTPVRQTGAVVSGTAHPVEARRFLEFLGRSEGQAILARFGFDKP